jgi:hypothetical protein
MGSVGQWQDSDGVHKSTFGPGIETRDSSGPIVDNPLSWERKEGLPTVPQRRPLSRTTLTTHHLVWAQGSSRRVHATGHWGNAKTSWVSAPAVQAQAGFQVLGAVFAFSSPDMVDNRIC